MVVPPAYLRSLSHSPLPFPKEPSLIVRKIRKQFHSQKEGIYTHTHTNIYHSVNLISQAPQTLQFACHLFSYIKAVRPLGCPEIRCCKVTCECPYQSVGETHVFMYSLVAFLSTPC